MSQYVASVTFNRAVPNNSTVRASDIKIRCPLGCTKPILLSGQFLLCEGSPIPEAPAENWSATDQIPHGACSECGLVYELTNDTAAWIRALAVSEQFVPVILVHASAGDFKIAAALHCRQPRFGTPYQWGQGIGRLPTEQTPQFAWDALRNIQSNWVFKYPAVARLSLASLKHAFPDATGHILYTLFGTLGALLREPVETLEYYGVDDTNVRQLVAQIEHIMSGCTEWAEIH